MRILIIRSFPNDLNINNYNCQEIGLAKALIRKGNKCDIVLYTSKEKNYEEDIFFENSKIHIYYLKAKKIVNNCFFDKKIKKIIKEYDIIQVSEYDQLGNIKLKKYANDKMIIYHGPYKSTYTKGYNLKCGLSDFILRFHKKYMETMIIAKSEMAKKFLMEKNFKNIETIGVGIDLDKLKNEESKNEFIIRVRKSKEKEGYKYILFVGRLIEDKDLNFVVELFNSLQKDNDKVRLIIIGDGEKRYKDYIFNKIEELDIKNKIFYYQKLTQNEIANLYSFSDILLLPSKYEIFGMVLLEAMHYGLITLSTKNGGSSTLIDSGKDGFVCESGNIDDWKEKINLVLQNEKIKNEISESAIKKINDNFTWDKLSEKFIEQYKKVLEG